VQFRSVVSNRAFANNVVSVPFLLNRNARAHLIAVGNQDTRTATLLLLLRAIKVGFLKRLVKATPSSLGTVSLQMYVHVGLWDLGLASSF